MSEREKWDLLEILSRWPLMVVLALASFYFLEPYEGNAFWLLFAIHTAIAVAIGMIGTDYLSLRIFLWGDELIGRSAMFLFLSWLAYLGIGAFVIAPVRPVLESVAPPVIALQNRLVGEAATITTTAHDGFFRITPLDWIRREIRYWNLPDENWDNRKFDQNDTQGLTFSKDTMSISTAGNGYYEALVRNDTNAVLKSVEMRLYIKGDKGFTFTLIADKPIRPQHEGKMSALIPHNGKTPTHKAVREWLDSRGSRNAGFLAKILRAETVPFNRQETFEKELGRWLDQ